MKWAGFGVVIQLKGNTYLFLLNIESYIKKKTRKQTKIISLGIVCKYVWVWQWVRNWTAQTVWLGVVVFGFPQPAIFYDYYAWNGVVVVFLFMQNNNLRWVFISFVEAVRSHLSGADAVFCVLNASRSASNFHFTWNVNVVTLLKMFVEMESLAI